MAAEDGRSSRGRMDRSLDEIAAEMHSQQQQMFGRGYEGREFERAPHRERDSKRYEPYSTRRDYGHSDRGHSERGSSSWRDRDRDEEESQGTRIFVANLNYTVSWQKLKDHMKRAGPVVKCDIFKNNDGSSRGMGLVVYADSESAERALRDITDTEIDGRKLFLRKDLRYEERERAGILHPHPRVKPLPNPAATVFVRNLDYSVTWQKLKDVFKVAGRIVNVEIQTDGEGRSRGCAVVQFEEPTEAIAAISLFHGQMLADRPMTVRMDSKAPYQPDPLQLKMSMGGLMGGSKRGLGSLTGGSGASASALGGLNIPLLAALGLSTLSPEQISLLSPALSSQLGKGGLGGSYSGSESHRSRYSGERRPPSPGYYHDRERDRDRERERERERDRGRDGHEGYEFRDHHQRPSFEGHYSVSPSSHGYFQDSGRSSSADYRSYEHERHVMGYSKGRKLFVRNLHFNTTWQRLKDHFRRVGDIAHVDVLKNPDGRSKGCAVVYFDHPDDAEKAIEMFNNTEVDGRIIEVRYDKMG